VTALYFVFWSKLPKQIANTTENY